MCSTPLQKARRLFHAAEGGDEDECRKLLNEGAEFNAGFLVWRGFNFVSKMWQL